MSEQAREERRRGSVCGRDVCVHVCVYICVHECGPVCTLEGRQASVRAHAVPEPMQQGLGWGRLQGVVCALQGDGVGGDGCVVLIWDWSGRPAVRQDKDRSLRLHICRAGMTARPGCRQGSRAPRGPSVVLAELMPVRVARCFPPRVSVGGGSQGQDSVLGDDGAAARHRPT